MQQQNLSAMQRQRQQQQPLMPLHQQQQVSQTPGAPQQVVTRPTHNVPAGTGGKAASKAGAYGGAEVGGMVGRLVGPPVVGGIVGNLVGERVGEDAARAAGFDKVADQLNSDLASAVGRRRADKVGEMALTAMGYSESEHCVCCPCLPASQVLFFLVTAFFVYNWYRLGVGIEFEAGCTSAKETDDGAATAAVSQVVEVHLGDNSTDDYIKEISTDSSRNVTLYLASYPCQFGFHYLVSGSAVWLAFLPFYVCSLFGNCYRQCCCCLCDPVVCLATACDCAKRCCCECGGFSLLGFVWSSMCIFQVIWAVCASVWLGETLTDPSSDYLKYDPDNVLIPTVVTSVVLDAVVAGSELFHKVRLYQMNRAKKKVREAAAAEEEEAGGGVEMQEIRHHTKIPGAQHAAAVP